jgi:protein-S-isoprenylcysteine O-methyltransferase Ste14
MVELTEHWISLIAKIAGAVAIVAPLIGYRRSLVRRRGRVAGKGQGALRWPFVLLLAIIYVGVGILLWVPIPFRLSLSLRIWLLVIGAFFYFPGVVIYLWGYVSLGRMFGVSSSYAAALYEGHRLIRSGPYKHLRHPMYLGVILAAIGAFFLFRTWAMAIYLPTALLIPMRARREDMLLAEEFGDEWEMYAQEVPGWIPSIKL